MGRRSSGEGRKDKEVSRGVEGEERRRVEEKNGEWRGGGEERK